MLKLKVLSAILFVSLFSSVAISNECQIAGVWSHSEKPAKLFIDLSTAEMLVQSHELNPKAVGLIVLKSLTLSSVTNSWKAKMYSAAEDSFVDVQLTTEGCNKLNVSFNGEEVLGLLR
ncbi:hypothetical protein [Psychrosphaera aestuarii]|uniref:hypothetical protein n=1 Tax=Psychrosphaera aestuarii TaxID=1266052 RepID=UPI001B32008B|nr:hypothetical protein [Psychrosphaera aestuarii]